MISLHCPPSTQRVGQEIYRICIARRIAQKLTYIDFLNKVPWLHEQAKLGADRTKNDGWEPAVEYWLVKEHLRPLADACLNYGKLPISFLLDSINQKRLRWLDNWCEENLEIKPPDAMEEYRIWLLNLRTETVKDWRELGEFRLT